MTIPNTPVPDELAAVRAQIKQLTDREAELKRLLITNPDIRTGASWLAVVQTVKQPRTDLKEMRHFHPDIVDEFTHLLEMTRVTLMGITEDGELVSAKRLAKAT